MTQTVPPEVLFSLDLEDHTGRYDTSSRYPEMTRRILAFCAARGIKGTIFTVAKVAQHVPELLREAHAEGHEIACHSLDHRLLTSETPVDFRPRLQQAKDILEQAIGAPVVGYRAPMFSLVPQTGWALDIIRALGFVYSSSIVPVKTPTAGWAGVSPLPFRWPNGLIEFPVPLLDLGVARLPYLGGVYLRYAPVTLLRLGMWRAPEGSKLWTYCHPYDVDVDEKFFRFDEVPLWASLLLNFNRRGMLRKLGKILSLAPQQRFVDLAASMP